jgi:hypothetical protein
MKQRARKGTIPWKMFTRLRNKNIWHKTSENELLQTRNLRERSSNHNQSKITHNKILIRKQRLNHGCWRNR